MKARGMQVTAASAMPSGREFGSQQDPLAQKQFASNQWLAKNKRDMIVCPNQPGQLMISKASCSKRYIMSRRKDLKDLLKGDFYQYIYIRGLSVCRDCPVGKKLVVARPAPRPRPADRP